MTSQSDLSQGGTPRRWERRYLGPSVGWVEFAGGNVLQITAAGTYTIDPSINIVEVSVAGAVTIILPSAIQPTVPAGVQPGLFGKIGVEIVDIGGNAAAHPITIQPASGSENILGLASIQITSNYGGFILYPSNTLKGWTNQS
jgi:hypothetical protein